jgi:tetratricopeptide (TPR) repeat protein
MKKLKIALLLTILAIFSGLAGCSLVKKEKVTDIPVTTSSKDALASVRQGLAMMDQGDIQKGRAFFIKAIEQDPKLAIAYILKSGEDRSPKEFADDLDKAKANLEGTSDWEKLYYDFYATFLSSDWNKRLEITQKIASAYPDAPRALVELGFVYTDGNQVPQGRECFEKAVKLDTGWVGGYYALFETYIFTDPKDFKKAEENALKVIQLAPTSQGAEIALGDCYRAQNDLNKAKDAYSKAIDLDPSTSEAYYKKGHANTFLGNFDEARQNYMDGAKHDENRISANEYIGYTYLYAGDYKKALEWFTGLAAKEDSSGESADKILTAKLNYYDFCSNIALHYGDAARVKYLIVVMEPLSIQVANYLESKEESLIEKGKMLYWQALLATMEGKFDLATGKAKENKSVLEPINDPNKLSDYEFVLGYVCMKQKKYKEAISHFEKTRQVNIHNKYWLAMAYEAAGKEDKALSLFNEISVYNFNELGYALVRNEVNQKLAMGK